MRKRIETLSLSIDGNPIYYRTGTPDKEVIGEMLVTEEYDIVECDLRSPALIVDCGAYAGYSTLYFLQKYKKAHVIAVEPDDDNFEICRLNLQPYGNRLTLVHGAVWPESARLVLHRGELADGREWATMVKAPAAGETPDVTGVTLESLLAQTGFAEIDLLKMNIECSEEAVFSRHYGAWLPRVRNMILQLHDERAEDVFFRAMADRGFLMARFPTIFALTAIGPKKDAPQPAVQPERNALANGDFEELRVAPAQIVPGGWIPGSTGVAKHWDAVVCDAPFHVSLAVRTGRQHSGENAILIRMNPEERVAPGSAPYAAIENSHPLPVQEGQEWHVRAFVSAAETRDALPGLTRGAYVFLRLRYDDGTTADLPTEALLEATGGYAERTGIVQIPATPEGRALQGATLWLYVWVVNPDAVEIPAADFGLWEVVFDDVSCTKI